LRNPWEKLRSVESKPDEIEITFGVKLSTVAGAVIASATAEANLGMTVRWAGKTEETMSKAAETTS